MSRVLISAMIHTLLLRQTKSAVRCYPVIFLDTSIRNFKKDWQSGMNAHGRE